MQLNLLHLDDAVKTQSMFMEKCASLGAHETDATQAASQVRLWGKDAPLESLRSQIASQLHRKNNDTVVTFMGSGDFHHVSALLIAMLAEQNNEPLTIIHFDNHPDWVHFSGGMHCGSWVNRALDVPQVQKVITIGVCSQDLKWPGFKGANLNAWRDGKIVLLPWHSVSAQFSKENIEHMGEEELLQSLDGLITTRNVYITIDKDVLSHKDAITNWDQGQMGLSQLLGIVHHILSNHHAIGVDITGDYSRPHYSGKLRQTMLKKIEALIDQPRPLRDTRNAATVNQASNLSILDCLREVL